MIDVREAATPLTNRRYTGNTEGAIYGFEQSMQNAYMNRISNRTPIKGLYLAGSWGNFGGGYAGVLRSGQMTFEMMMRDWGGVSRMFETASYAQSPTILRLGKTLLYTAFFNTN